ncbi:hypothetical protein G6F62_002538 [Rhizopus arrhizus]|nr:hypothetical protein G6F23_001977 [Rhizopus arrhizus]KAG0766092.1 hypothetical protein G6F24_003884 [Rhizopus arrhizus]KAG0790489.1 hypothetical protein G6F21_005769 [Rhizopus arrhizus]KAG0801572.1 hypothetical protein G6F22_001113 [Rhizopus arrhizus]KAG0815864.1 hypothetical protein G6F20_003652 [Rhizopus arrhizus]
MVKKSTILVVSTLLWLRWFISGLPGYIHPDEFFQNPEITSSKIFGIQTFTPWEYQPQNAARSIVAPFITTGIPFWILKCTLPRGQLPSASILFAVERFGSFVWSLIIGKYLLCKHIGLSKPSIPMLLVATSHVTLAYYTHPFSNSFESILLCLCLSLFINHTKTPSNKLSYFLGGLFSLGTFTRITFPLYALPIGILFLMDSYKKQSASYIISLVLGIITFTVFCITADSVYYGALSITLDGQPFTDVNQFISTLFNPVSLIDVRAEGNLIVTPINNLLYNMNVNNLQQHGIHSRYTHFLVNLPLLFGPLAIQTFLESPSIIKRAVSDNNRRLFFLLVTIILTSLVGLSIIPHQEARFLCPLLVPLVIIYSWKRPTLSTSFWISWFLFNVIATYVFGVIHQGGLVPTMRFLHHQTKGIHDCHVLRNEDLACRIGANTDEIIDYNLTTKLLFYKTYMPPQHLLVNPLEVKDNHQVNILDFSSRHEDLIQELEQSSGVVLRRHAQNEIEFAKTNTKNKYERTLFITPSYVILPKIPNHRYMLIASFSPHVGFDDIDKIISRIEETNSPETQINLNVFLLLSDKDDVL